MHCICPMIKTMCGTDKAFFFFSFLFHTFKGDLCYNFHPNGHSLFLLKEFIRDLSEKQGEKYQHLHESAEVI